MYEISRGLPLLSDAPALHMYFPLSIHGKERPGAGFKTPLATRILESRVLAPLAAEQNEWDGPVSGGMGFMLRCYFERRPRGDWDNLGKIVSDALNGITYHDDAQILYGSVEVLQARDKPGVSLTLVRLKDDFKFGGIPR
jgi:Holliday junction resolvase RusA-like endonuclease